jgi:TonB family protein
MGCLPLSRCLAFIGLAVSLLVLAAPAAQAADAATPPKLNLERRNIQPVYPDGAVDKKEQGNTVLAVAVSDSGRITNVAVETSSGFDDLDKTAIAAVRRLTFSPASDGHGDVAGTMKLTVHFQLSPLPGKPITETDVYALTDIGEMMVCKKPQLALGSYIEGKPVCHTKREWDAIAKSSRDGSSPLEHPNSAFRPGY